MEYNKILSTLKRHNFSSKLNYCFRISKDFIVIKDNFMKLKIFPWEIETYCLFAVMAKEWKDDDLKEKKFIEIINLIKDFNHPELESLNTEFIDRLSIQLLLEQRESQEDKAILFYRYNYIFNFNNSNLDMNIEFSRKFNAEYKDFQELCLYINLLNLINYNNDNIISKQKIIAFFQEKYKKAFEQLTISRKDFITIQSEITRDIKDYKYGIKLFFLYPFIGQEKNIYLPLPHVLTRATTKSLLFRLTQDNNELKARIGKEVYENYLFDILNKYSSYDELLTEQKYGKPEKLTPDLLIRSKNQCVFVESKSIVPFANTRNLDKECINTPLERMSEGIVQLYKYLNFEFKNSNYPFNSKTLILKENTYGVLVVFEDSYIRRNKIYDKAAINLGIKLHSKEYDYLCSNIKILSLYEFESLVFNKNDMFKILEKARNDKKTKFNYFSTYIENNSNCIYQEVIHDQNEIIKKMTEELVEKKLIANE